MRGPPRPPPACPPHTASIGALSVARHRPHHGVRGRLLADPPPRGLLAAAGTPALISRLEVVLGHSRPAHSSITSGCHHFSTKDLLCMFTNIKCNKIYWITYIFCPNTVQYLAIHQNSGYWYKFGVFSTLNC